MSLRKLLTSATVLFAALMLCAFTSNPSHDAAVVVTLAPAYDALAALRRAERFPAGAELAVIQNGVAKPLVTGFAASADASVSFDAKHVLFAGKRTNADPWSIWMLTLADGSVRQVLSGATDIIRPLYLPGGRMVYARATAQGFRMETASLDGSTVAVLTFVHGSTIPEDVLADGRILFQAQFPLGTDAGAKPVPELYLAYSDGSGVESYRCDHGAPRWGGRQLASGDVVFTNGTALARFTSPKAAEVPIASPSALYDGSIVETSTEQWMMPARLAQGARFSFVSWRPGSVNLRVLYSQPERHVIQPVLLSERKRPKIHPSALHAWNYANLLALDVRQSREGDLASAPASVRLETQDASGNAVLLGAAPVESDGSFFVKVRADAPLRFTLLDASGKIVRQEHGWFWIRAGEQRICVGCHTGPERSSENRVPAVLLRTTTPVDLTAPVPPNNAAHAAQGSR